MYARLSQAQIKLTSLGHIKHNQCQQRWCVRCPDFWAVLAVCDQVQKCSIYRDMVTVVTPHQFSSGGTLDTSHTSYSFTQSGDGSFRNGKDLSCGKQHLTLQVPIKSIHLKNLINYLYDNQYIQHSHRRSFGLKKSGIALVIKMPCFHTISMLVLIGTCLPCGEKIQPFLSWKSHHQLWSLFFHSSSTVTVFSTQFLSTLNRFQNMTHQNS